MMCPQMPRLDASACASQTEEARHVSGKPLLKRGIKIVRQKPGKKKRVVTVEHWEKSLTFKLEGVGQI